MLAFLLSAAVALAGEPAAQADGILPTMWGARTVDRVSGTASVGLGTQIGVGTIEVGTIAPITRRIDVRPIVRFRPTISFYPIQLALTVAAPFRFEADRNPRSSVAFLLGPEVGYEFENRVPLLGLQGAFLASWQATPAPAVGTLGVEAGVLGYLLSPDDLAPVAAYSHLHLAGGVEGRVGSAMVGLKLFAGVMFGPFYERLLDPTAGAALTIGGPARR